MCPELVLTIAKSSSGVPCQEGNKMLGMTSSRNPSARFGQGSSQVQTCFVITLFTHIPLFAISQTGNYGVCAYCAEVLRQQQQADCSKIDKLRSFLGYRLASRCITHPALCSTSSFCAYILHKCLRAWRPNPAQQPGRCLR